MTGNSLTTQLLKFGNPHTSFWWRQDGAAAARIDVAVGGSRLELVVAVRRPSHEGQLVVSDRWGQFDVVITDSRRQGGRSALLIWCRWTNQIVAVRWWRRRFVVHCVVTLTRLERVVCVVRRVPAQSVVPAVAPNGKIFKIKYCPKIWSTILEFNFTVVEIGSLLQSLASWIFGPSLSR